MLKAEGEQERLLRNVRDRPREREREKDKQAEWSCDCNREQHGIWSLFAK